MTIHSHPSGLPPSVADYNYNYERKVKAIEDLRMVKDFYKERGFGLIKEDGVGNTEWLLEVVDYKPLDTKTRME